MKKHRFFYCLLRPLVVLFAKIRFGYRYEKARNLPETYIVLSNHTTDYDQLFVAASFPRMMYFVGSEHISRWGFLYQFLKFCFDPIMRPKGASAASTVKEMIRRAKRGDNLCLFAEGVRSWDGAPCPIAPSTAKMVQRMGCGLVTYRITGGYFASPMWAGASVRRGPLHGAPVHVFTAEQLAAMDTEELYRIIVEDLGENAYERQLADPKPYKHKSLAEGMENILFLCPLCKEHDTFHTMENTVTCSNCGLSFRYNEHGMLENSPYTTVQEFHAWQKGEINGHTERNVIYTAGGATLSTVKDHVLAPVTSGPVSMDTQTLRCGEAEFPMDTITDLAMHGQRAVVFTANKVYYELIIDEGWNALKFMLYYNASKARTASASEATL